MTHSVLLSLAGGGWQSAMDSKGRKYYFNKTLCISQYEPPFDVGSPPLPPPAVDLSEWLKRRPPASASSARLFSSRLGSTPEASSSNSTSRKQPVVSYDVQQLLRERARLRAMVSHMSGKEKADILGDIAAIESDLQYL